MVHSTWPFGFGVRDSLIFIVLKFLFIGLILGLVILFLKIMIAPSIKEPVESDPFEILKIRLAKGEISEDEYNRLRSIINKS